MPAPPPSPPASPSRPRPPVRRAVLERLARPLLSRFLSTHAADFCAAHAFPLPALHASDPRDRTLVHRLFALLHADALPAFPEAALRWLAALDALACTRGGELLIARDTGRVLPRAKLGDEDLALTAILELPELALEAQSLLPSEAGDGIDGFTEYDPASPYSFEFDDAKRATFESLCGDELEARDRTRYCFVYVTRESKRLALEIEYCRRPKTRDKLDVETLAVAPATDVNAERAFAEIDAETGRLALHAPHAAIKDVIRKALGRVLAGSEAHFTAARVYDLSPFRKLDEALKPDGDRLLSVALHQITLRTVAEVEIDLSRARRDVRGDTSVASILNEATTIGFPVAVKLYLGILGRKTPLKVELSAKQGRNRLHFNRTDPEVVAIVRGYLLARGVLREITPIESAPASQASNG